MSNRRLLLSFSFLAFALTRAWVLLGGIEEIAINDELTTGLLSQGARGLGDLPLSVLWAPTVGGDLVYQVLALPFYAVLGDSLLAAKLLAFAIALGFFWLLLHVARYHGGDRAERWAALLMILEPSGWTGLSLICTGDHFLNGGLSILCGHLACRLREAGPDTWRKRSLLLGALVGLSLYVHYLFVVCLPAVLVMLLLGGPRSFPRWKGVLGVGVGGLLGLSPLLLNFAFRGVTASTTVYQRGAGDQFLFDPSVALQRVAKLLVVDLPASAWSASDVLGLMTRWAGWGALTGLLLLLVWHLLRARLAANPKASPTVATEALRPSPAPMALFGFLFLGSFLLLWAVARIDFEPRRLFGYRYLGVLHVTLCLLAAFACAHAGRRLAPILGLTWALAGLIGLRWPASFGEPGRILSYPGVTWTNAAARALDHWGERPGSALRDTLERIPEPQRSSFLFGLGSQAAMRWPLDRALSFSAQGLSVSDQNHMHRGMLGIVARRGPKALGASNQAFRTLERHFSKAFAPVVVMTLEGAASTWGAEASMLERQFEEPGAMTWTRPLAAEALGSALFEREGLDGTLARLDRFDVSLGERLLMGAGVRWALRGIPQNADIGALSRRLGERVQQRGFWQGAGRALARLEATADAPVDVVLSYAPLVGERGRATFSKEIGRGAAEQIDRSPHRFASTLRALPNEDLAPFCEGMGVGVALGSKTLTDLLRWRIDWDRFAGVGCGGAFEKGLGETLRTSHALSPDSRAFYTRRLRLDGGAP
jgi:hypothetical protein